MATPHSIVLPQMRAQNQEAARRPAEEKARAERAQKEADDLSLPAKRPGPTRPATNEGRDP
jgi:hypothetical protein